MKNDLKARKIELNINDSDLKTLAEICGRRGISVQELLETFIGDLTGGQSYSGSDEGDLADQWLDRHTWGGEESLLQWIMSAGGGLRDAEAIVTAWDEKELYEADPDKCGDDQGKWWDQDIQEITDGYESPLDASQIEKVREWLKNYQKIAEEE